MRRRRFTRCVHRAEAAIESSALEDARAALDEARGLMPDAPEVAALEARIVERPDASMSSRQLAGPDDVPSVRERDPSPEDLSLDNDGSDDPDESAIVALPSVELVHSAPVLVHRDDRGGGPLKWAVLALALMGVVSYALMQIHVARSPQQETSASLARATDTGASAGRPQLADMPKPVEKASPPAKPTIPAPTRAAARPASPAAAIDSGGSRGKAREVLHQPSKTIATRAAPPLGVPSSSARKGSSVARVPAITERDVVPEPPAPRTPSPNPVATIGVNEPPRPDPPPLAAESRRGASGDDHSQIRAVLTRYESAYNRLDAKAASSVWPSVNSAELDRAFKGLVSQKISLGSCDILKIGDKGLVTCAGRAAWEPRVGGGTQTAQRYWAFDVRKNTEGWRIDKIRVR